ncbi:MAG TPA: MoaD/ThiS family protein [Acidimicrobiales bacterium]|nr:MoaD/ThiS family protein [Acidimicrobiales bacterium]
MAQTGAAGSPTAAVTVLFFASAREAAGVARTAVNADGTTVDQLAKQLCATYGPGLEAVMATCATWVNGAPAKAATLLVAGDEVAVVPPVSGG